MSKTQFVFLLEADFPVGVALPWAIYLTSGELLAPAGFVVADEVVRTRLLMTKPVRIAREGERGNVFDGGADDKSPRVAADPLKYLKHNAEGVVLVFKLPSDMEPRTAQVEFLGRIPMQAVIVAAPPLGLGHSQTWNNFEGLPMAVQVIFGRNLCVFNTSVMRYSALPSHHLFLRYPEEAVNKPFRQALRVEARIPASITMPDGYTVPALITDLSGSGCAISTGFVLGQTGTVLNAAFRVKIGDKFHVLSVPCIIKSIKGRLSQQMRYGIQFDDTVDDKVLLTLKSYVYEHLAER
jgi:hypothetical protein